MRRPGCSGNTGADSLVTRKCRREEDLPWLGPPPSAGRSGVLPPLSGARWRGDPSGLIARFLILLFFIFEGGTEEPMPFQALHELIRLNHRFRNIGKDGGVILHLDVEVAGDVGQVNERIVQARG